jgi:hypothetical protein
MTPCLVEQLFQKVVRRPNLKYRGGWYAAGRPKEAFFSPGKKGSAFDA